jgi:hypothetical protein
LNQADPALDDEKLTSLKSLPTTLQLPDVTIFTLGASCYSLPSGEAVQSAGDGDLVRWFCSRLLFSKNEKVNFQALKIFFLAYFTLI